MNIFGDPKYYLCASFNPEDKKFNPKNIGVAPFGLI